MATVDNTAGVDIEYVKENPTPIRPIREIDPDDDVPPED